MIDLNEVGASASFNAAGNPELRVGLYLPGVRASDRFSVVVRVIHTADRFDPAVPTKDVDLAWQPGHTLDLWTATVPLTPASSSHLGQEGIYLYRFQLFWTPPGGSKQLVTAWFPDPFARSTDIGRLSAVRLSHSAPSFVWTDNSYRTPDLDDLIVYEMQVEEFNDSFDGVTDRLTYLQSLGVNCLELMPVMSSKLDFDWGYGPLNYFAPSPRLGGGDSLKRLVNAAHGQGMAVILDVVYEHVDPMFAYFRVYQDIADTTGTPKPASPMIRGFNKYGFGPATDFDQDFTREFFLLANKMWLDEYHADGFRYDEVSDWYEGTRAAGYRDLTEQTYRHSLTIPRFQRAANSYSRIIQAAEALGKARQILRETFSNAAWQDELLNKAEDMIKWRYANADIAHLLDTRFSGYPDTKTVVDASGNSVEMPVAPFQYVETHDHSPLIVWAGTEGEGPLPEGDRDQFYRTQPYAIALYTCQGVPMLWEGQEIADNYNLPDNGLARVHLRRDLHWEYFYDTNGSALIRLYRRLGQLRRTLRCLRSRESFYYFQQSLQGNQVIAYHRHAPAAGGQAEEFAMVLLNFGDSAGTIRVPFPKAGTWHEMIDKEFRDQTVNVGSDGAVQTIIVPSNYGMIFVPGA